MHEMGIVLNIVSIAEKQAKINKAEKVARLTLRIGELTGVYTQYVRKCWPAATQGTLLENCELVVEDVDGILICSNCGEEYLALENLKQNKAVCPKCNSEKWAVKSGREVEIKEIAVF